MNKMVIYVLANSVEAGTHLSYVAHSNLSLFQSWYGQNIVILLINPRACSSAGTEVSSVGPVCARDGLHFELKLLVSAKFLTYYPTAPCLTCKLSSRRLRRRSLRVKSRQAGGAPVALCGLPRARIGNGRSWWLRTLLDTPGLAEGVRVESRNVVLNCEFTYRNASAILNTTRCAILFRRLLEVSMVSLPFLTYRDAFLFALSMHWDVDVARYSLSPEQSQAAFTLGDLLARDQSLGGGAHGAREPHPHGGHDDCDGAGRTGAAVEGVGPPEGTDADCKDPDKYAMTKGNIRAVRK